MKWNEIIHNKLNLTKYTLWLSFWNRVILCVRVGPESQLGQTIRRWTWVCGPYEESLSAAPSMPILQLICEALRSYAWGQRFDSQLYRPHFEGAKQKNVRVLSAFIFSKLERITKGTRSEGAINRAVMTDHSERNNLTKLKGVAEKSREDHHTLKRDCIILDV